MIYNKSGDDALSCLGRVSELGDLRELSLLPLSFRSYYDLTKPRVMWLAVLSSLVGMLSAGVSLSLIDMVSLLAISFGAASSGALNMYFDRADDAKMKRTRSRPIPSGFLSSDEALSFGLLLGFVGVFLLGLVSNWFAGLFLLGTIIFYSCFYTLFLKRYTKHNIVIGGLAGAVPPIIGAIAVTGEVTFSSILICTVIFLWTPPHFWSLAINMMEDYRGINIPMMPVVTSVKRTLIESTFYTSLIFPFVLWLFYENDYSVYWLLFNVVIYGYFLYKFGYLTFTFLRSEFFGISKDLAGVADVSELTGSGNSMSDVALRQGLRSCFFVSIVYLFLFFFSIIVEETYLVLLSKLFWLF